MRCNQLTLFCTQSSCRVYINGIFFPHLEIKLLRSSSSPRFGSRLKSSIQSNTYYTHAKRESAVPSIPDAQEAHHRAFPHANVHPKAHPHPTHPHQMHTAALSLLASISATPAGRTVLWAEPPGPAARKLRLAYLPELVLESKIFLTTPRNQIH